MAAPALWAERALLTASTPSNRGLPALPAVPGYQPWLPAEPTDSLSSSSSEVSSTAAACSCWLVRLTAGALLQLPTHGAPASTLPLPCSALLPLREKPLRLWWLRLL